MTMNGTPSTDTVNRLEQALTLYQANRAPVIVVTGSLPITFSDFGITAPNSFAVLSVSDNATMELQLFFTKS